jgi:predicted SAM-dependent methyltransferase
VKLEIGPGKHPVPGFTTFDVDPGTKPDILGDASGKIPLEDGSCEIVFASHILEHLVWYDTQKALAEWVRVLQPGGRLEVWVPNAYEICKAFIAYEHDNDDQAMKADGWYRQNPDKDFYVWFNGRIFTYGDGKGKLDHPNWHRTLFSPRYLCQLLRVVGLKDVRMLDPKRERRGVSHGWIDMGAMGVK